MEVGLSTDKIIEKGHSMITIIEVILKGEILEECKIIEVKCLEMDIEVASGMVILGEVEVGVEKDNSQANLGGVIGAVVGQDKVLE